MACFNIFDVFNIILHRVCSMQYESPTSSTYPGSCKSCFSRKPVFGGKVLLIFPIIYQIAHCIIGQPVLWSLLTAVLDGLFSCLRGYFLSWLLNFIEYRRVLASLTSLTLEITFKLLSVMPKPVFLMTVQEAHKEYNSLRIKSGPNMSN